VKIKNIITTKIKEQKSSVKVKGLFLVKFALIFLKIRKINPISTGDDGFN
jgi:hypothetical protein